jgi:hypothetical protein
LRIVDRWAGWVEMSSAYDILRKVPGGRERCGTRLTLEGAQEELAKLKKAKPGNYIIIEQKTGLAVASEFTDEETND